MTDTPVGNILLRNARLVLPARVIDHGSLLVVDGRVASFSEDEISVTGAKQEIDLENATVYPGFIDVHIHGAVGVDTMEAGAEDLARVSKFLTKCGVTGWLPTFVPAPATDYERSIKAIEEASKLEGGARILGVHYEGPFVNTAQCGALRTEFFRSFSAVANIDDLPVLRDHDARHMMTLAPEIDGGLELVHQLKQRGWIVSIGHTRAGFEILDKALAAGARHMTHFMNAMTPLHHRSPGPVAWGLLRDEVTCDLIADGVHLDPQVIQLLIKSKGAERLTLISDAIAPAGLGDGDFHIWGETIAVRDGRTKNEKGSIAGSVISLLDAVLMMRLLGVPEVDVARMASTNPARLLGIEHDCGTIAEGKRADLVALTQEGNVRLTLVGGRPQG